MAGTPMQGMYSMWYDHYKGAVYPLDLDAPPHLKLKRMQVPTLLEACCAYIARDASLTRQTIEEVPPILCIHLMEAALKGNHDRSIQALMSQWKLPSLVLSKLVPTVYSSFLPLYDSTYQSDLVRQGLRYTTSLAHTFLECLRQESPTKIRRLDLTGFPTAEVILYYLTSHCMLVHNENRRNNMVNLYNQAVSIAEDCGADYNSRHKPLDIDMQNCLPQNISIEIKLDAFVTSESCHSELCKALTVSSFPGARFALIVERLSVTCLGGDRVNLLLKQVKQEYLKGLQLKYNSLRNTDFVRMAPVVQSLTQLTSLDLSCNHLNLVDNAPMATVVRQTLSTLSQLERLDISNSRLKNKLSVVLGGLSGHLKHLRLSGCGLTPLDLSGLVRLVQTNKHTLEELDLSENRLGAGENGHSLRDNFHGAGQSLMLLLESLVSSLRLLELQECSLDSDLARSLTSLTTRMERLLLLNLQANPWSSACVLEVAGRFLSQSSSLHILQLSYPPDCYPSLEEEDHAGVEADLKARFHLSIKRLDRNSRNSLQLLFSEMDHTMAF
ncbi:leucine-rich repeat-containing protein 14 [Plakobranchus ocellatus]|uniref:Leucine-rich repeat-containing protein 14 n=1 Tax=Plakobranchus ocellatus TaxID=259542 RepID=A0AAV3ZWY3_9GAST|nr:leucine-rich repeat-containing protein 14 [Plakobranchus ocellatus]